MALLEINNLHTFFKTKKGILKAVNDVSFTLEEGITLGIVGESGSGKSACAMSILRLLDSNGYIDKGEIVFDGQDILKLSQNQLYQIRGKEIATIFQEPMTSLNPVFKIEKQLQETFLIHEKISKAEAQQKVIDMLSSVKIPNPHIVAKQYPHELSGGMRQRIMIAMALSLKPKLLIADEPTTALDVTISAQILKLMNHLKKEINTSILFITHDLGVVNQMADKVIIMYCGEIVEKVDTSNIFGNKGYTHPYTQGLLNATPRLDTPIDAKLQSIPGTAIEPYDIPVGCKFAPRCQYAKPICTLEKPQLLQVDTNHYIRCFYPVIKGEANGR